MSLFRLAACFRLQASPSLRQTRIPSTFFRPSNPAASFRNGSNGSRLQQAFRRAYNKNFKPYSINKSSRPPSINKSSKPPSINTEDATINNGILYACVAANIGICGWFQLKRYMAEQGGSLEPIYDWYENFTLNLDNVRQNGRWWTVFTAAFGHTDYWHIFCNMASALYIGSFLTTTPGFKPARLVTLIVGSALTGSSGWLFQQWLKAEEGKPNRNYGLGFSGVVMGMSVVASLLDPLRKVPIYGIIPVPLWALSAGYLVYDSFFLNKKSNVGHAGHLGGMAFGFLYYFASIRRGVFIPTRV